MSGVFIRNLFIIYLCLFPVLVQSANDIVSENTNTLPDSARTSFNQRISDAENDSIKWVEAHFDYGKYLAETGNPEESIKQLN
jgi:hypothetical protein